MNSKDDNIENTIGQHFSTRKTDLFAKTKPYYWIAVVFVIYSLVFSYFKHTYLPVDGQFILGLVLIPFIVNGFSDSKSWRYLFWALLFFGLLTFRRSSTLYYFGFGFAVLFLVESTIKKLNYLPLLMWLVISPFFSHASNILSFPLRLKLSELAAQSISLLGKKAIAEGNIILFDGMEFAVDEACLGLNMMTAALISGLLVMWYYERKEKRQLGLMAALMALGVVLVLSVINNYTRIVVLTLFKILPENPMHDIIGLAGLVVYVIIPFYFLFKYFSKYFFKFHINTKLLSIKTGNLKKPRGVSFAGLLILMVITGRQFKTPVVITDDKIFQMEFPDYQSSRMKNGVLKLENKKLLVYIKPPSKPFQGSHDPRYCWRGSGYKFSQIKKETLSGHEVYTAVLHKGDDTIYTAWWFDNGSNPTISEVDWRWGTLSGNSGYYLVNVSSDDREKLGDFDFSIGE